MCLVFCVVLLLRVGLLVNMVRCLFVLCLVVSVVYLFFIVCLSCWFVLIC